MEPAGRPGDGQPVAGPPPEGSGEPDGGPAGTEGPGEPGPGGPAEPPEAVPAPVPRAFAIRSPGAGPDDGVAG
jgi:hypothetical protein